MHTTPSSAGNNLWLPGMAPKVPFAVKKLFLLVAILSFMVSLLVASSHDPINIDGLLYLQAAQVTLSSGFRASMEIYNWPFYSWLIAGTQAICFCSLEHAAYLLNAFLQAILCVSFLGVLQTLGASKKQLYWGAVVILLYPYLNGIRGEVIRDFGYWAMSFCGLWALLRYQMTQRWREIFCWYLAMTIASLFRVEGIIFLVLAPLALLWAREEGRGFSARWWSLIRLYGLGFLFLAIVSFVASHLSGSFSLEKLTRLGELQKQVTSSLWNTFDTLNTYAQSMATALPDSPAQHNGLLFLISGFFGLLILTIWQSTTSLYLLLSLYGFFQKQLPGEKAQHKLVYFFIILNVVILSFFTLQVLFLDKRYTAFLSLLLLLWIPGALVRFAEYRHTGADSCKRYLLPIVCILLLVSGVSGIVRWGYSKAYITEAGWWLKNNTPNATRLYSNSEQVLHYAEKPLSNWPARLNQKPSLKPLTNGSWKQYDFLVVRVDKRDTATAAVVNRLGLKPVQIFSNRRGDQALIFEIAHP